MCVCVLLTRTVSRKSGNLITVGVNVSLCVHAECVCVCFCVCVFVFVLREKAFELI